MQIGTPDSGRLDSKSSLDFSYWVISSVDTFQPRNTASIVFSGSSDDEIPCIQLLLYGATQVGVDIPADFDMLLNKINSGGYAADPTTLFRTRGALLIKNRGIAVTVGDDKRIVETVGGIYLCRALVDTERAAGFWDSGAFLPNLRYM
jgi:hypothetical protein